MDKWDSLDADARSNLHANSLERFFRYKARLQNDGHAWENDAEAILTGFIWDEIEEYDD